MDKEWLRGKSVVIVGASAGIGKYLAFNLILKYNCKVIAISNNDKQMEEFINKISEYKDNFSYFIFDATKEKNWTDFFTDINSKGIFVDVLINCVGELPIFKEFSGYSYKELTETMNANFYSAVFSIRYLLPLLKKSKTPSIINISCLSAVMPVAGTSVYSASKAALKSYTEILTSELENKFYVSLVLIGTVKTEFYKNQDEKVSKKILNKALSPQFVANKILLALAKKKERIVIGFRTRAYDRFSRVFPIMSRKLTKKLMERKNIKLYKDGE